MFPLSLELSSQVDVVPVHYTADLVFVVVYSMETAVININYNQLEKKRKTNHFSPS